MTNEVEEYEKLTKRVENMYLSLLIILLLSLLFFPSKEYMLALLLGFLVLGLIIQFCYKPYLSKKLFSEYIPDLLTINGIRLWKNKRQMKRGLKNATNMQIKEIINECERKSLNTIKDILDAMILYEQDNLTLTYLVLNPELFVKFLKKVARKLKIKENINGSNFEYFKNRIGMVY